LGTELVSRVISQNALKWLRKNNDKQNKKKPNAPNEEIGKLFRPFSRTLSLFTKEFRIGGQWTSRAIACC
jgi:hypothetical protein